MRGAAEERMKIQKKKSKGKNQKKSKKKIKYDTIYSAPEGQW